MALLRRDDEEEIFCTVCAGAGDDRVGPAPARGEEMSEALTRKLVSAGISYSRDGLLRDYVTRGLYSAAIEITNAAIERRLTEVLALRELIDDLNAEIGK